MPARIEVAPELMAEGKYLYEETLIPTDEIGARMGLSRSAFYLRVKEWKWKRRRYSTGIAEDAVKASVPPAMPDTSATPPAEPPLAFAERLQRVLDGELAVIERTLKVLGPASNAEAERTTRILAAISRTVQEIQASAEGQTSSDEADDDAVPGDIDEFRETLTRRIRGFIEARTRNPSGGDGGSVGDVERGGT